LIEKREKNTQQEPVRTRDRGINAHTNNELKKNKTELSKNELKT